MSDTGRIPVDRTTFLKRRIQVKLKKIILAVALLAVIIIAAVLFLVHYNNLEYTELRLLSVTDWHRSEAATVLSYNGDLLSYSADGIHCTDSKGKDKWSVPFTMQKPFVRIAGNYVTCVDTGGRTVYVFDKNGQTASITENNPVERVEISAGGMVAVVLNDNDVTPIHLYDSTGTQIASFRTTMSRSGYPVAIGISPNNRLVGVSYLYADSGAMTSKLAFYNFGDVGKNETDNVVSGYDNAGTLIPVLAFLDNDTAFALSTERLMIFDGSQSPKRREEMPELQGEVRAEYHGTDSIGLVYLDKSGQARYRMDIYNSKGEMRSSIYFNMEYDDIFFHDDRVVIYNAGECLIYKVNGVLKYHGDFKEPVKLMMPGDMTNRYKLITESGIWLSVLK
ncbi:MAG: DUF5711 family protein [Lachnospiraceae bacterium]|nr:DUF5711 family protein [Lachnospiraceae bacterium]